jgi:hypothetical protein
MTLGGIFALLVGIGWFLIELGISILIVVAVFKAVFHVLGIIWEIIHPKSFGWFKNKLTKKEKKKK